MVVRFTGKEQSMRKRTGNVTKHKSHALVGKALSLVVALGSPAGLLAAPAEPSLPLCAATEPLRWQGEGLRILLLRGPAAGIPPEAPDQLFFQSLPSQLPSRLQGIEPPPQDSQLAARLSSSEVQVSACRVTSHTQAQAYGAATGAQLVLWTAPGCSGLPLRLCDGILPPPTGKGAPPRHPDADWGVPHLSTVAPNTPEAKGETRLQPPRMDYLELLWSPLNLDALPYAVAALEGARTGAYFDAARNAQRTREKSPQHPRWLDQLEGSALLRALPASAGASEPLAVQAVERLTAARSACLKGELRCQLDTTRALAWADERLNGPASALKRVDESLLLATRLGDKGMMALALHDQGLLYQALTPARDARPVLQRGLSLAREAKDANLELALRLQLGSVLRTQKAYGEALEQALQAEGLAQKLSDARALLRAQVLEVTSRQALEQYAKAFETSQDALARARTLEEQESTLELLVVQGTLAERLKQPEVALRALEEALPQTRQQKRQALEAQVLNGLARVSLAQGQRDAGLRYLLEALPVVEQLKDPAWEAGLLIQAAKLQKEVGRLEEALTLVERSVALVDRQGEVGWQLERRLEAGQLNEQLGKLEAARTHYDAGLALLSKAGETPLAAPLLTAAARLAQTRGEGAQALSLLQRAQVEVARSKDVAWEAALWEQISQQAAALERYPEALQAAQRALPLIEKTGNISWERGISEHISRLHFALGQDAEGQRALEQAEKRR